MESYENYVIKNNNNVVGNASILKSARNVVLAGDVMLVPLLPMEDVAEEASTSSISINRRQEMLKELIVVEDLESSVKEHEEDTDTDDSSSESDVESGEKMTAEDTENPEAEDPSRLENSPMIFAIPVDDKDKAKCMLCNKVMNKKSFYKHIDAVHTSNKSAKDKCVVCGKLMLKKSLSMHMKSVHHIGNRKGKARANCDECGSQMLKGNLARHLREVHGITTSTK